MKHISKRISVILLSTVICCVFCESTVFALSKIGSQGQEVTNIQTRLKSWGYYSGSVDGIYGWRTANAVKEFQRKNGYRRRYLRSCNTFKNRFADRLIIKFIF